MRRITSKQVGVPFVFCPSPVVIDKRAEWGDSADNLQQGPKGAFLKINVKNGVNTISHLVQPNEERTAPIGWVPGSSPGTFDKAPIWVLDSEIIQPGQTVTMVTKDGPMGYTAKEPSVVTYNGDANGPDRTDGWIQTLANVQKNYNF